MAPAKLSALDDGRSPGELSDEQVEKAIDELDAAEENRDVARRAIREGGDNAIASIAELDDPTVLYEFVEEAGEDATEFIRRVDDSNTLERFFELDFSRINNAKFRANLARLQATSDVVRVSDVTRYIDDLSEIRRLSEDGVKVNNADRIARAVTEGTGTPERFVGAQLEADRVRFYAQRASESDSNIVRIDVDPEGPDSRVDIEIERADGSARFVEAKNIQGQLQDGFTLRDKIEQARQDFEESSLSFNSEYERVITIGTKRDGIANDLDPDNRVTDEPLGPRESIKTLVENRDEVPDFLDTVETADNLSFDTIRIVRRDKPPIVVDMEELFDEIG